MSSIRLVPPLQSTRRRALEPPPPPVEIDPMRGLVFGIVFSLLIWALLLAAALLLLD